MGYKKYARQIVPSLGGFVMITDLKSLASSKDNAMSFANKVLAV
ncbi:MAG: hypothetical protein ACI8RO_000399, partial [Flavobacteriales bacterium]